MLRLVTPDLYPKGVLEVEPAFLRSLGLEGLLLDLDGTLKDFGAEAIPAEVVSWVARLRAAGFKLCLLSNGRPQRIARYAAVLEVPFVAKAFKPLPRGCNLALKQLGLRPGQVGIIGDQVYADVLAGRLAGLFTILVPPTSRVEPWFTRLKRPLEWLTLRCLRLRPGLAVGSAEINSAAR